MSFTTWNSLTPECAKSPFPIEKNAENLRLDKRDLYLRGFGFYGEDREVDFQRTPRPILEIQIIQCCTTTMTGTAPSQDFFLSLEISRRTECLLIITALTERSDTLSMDLRCMNSECEEEMEMDVSLKELSNLRKDTDNSPQCEMDWENEIFNFRRPTGEDQLLWLNQAFSNEHDAVHTMIKTLLVDNSRDVVGQLLEDDQFLNSVDKTMRKMDPLVDFPVRVVCPYCGTQNNQHVDLGRHALNKLYGAQTALFETIHSLATWYHWSERDILTMQPHLRVRYLKLIEKEKNN